MNRPNPMLFNLQELVAALSLVDRDHHILNSDRPENDIEHSFSVAMICWYMQQRYAPELDITKILKYALVHDFAERYAGDVNTFASDEDRKNKVLRESESLERLSVEFNDFGDLVDVMQAYEKRDDLESLFVWTVDKMQAMILGDLDNWRPYKKINISFESFSKKHSDHIALGSPYCKAIFNDLLEYCKTTYYDRPTAKS